MLHYVGTQSRKLLPLELYHGVNSSFFGIGILLVSDLLDFRITVGIVVLCKLWREHILKFLRELFF